MRWRRFFESLIVLASGVVALALVVLAVIGLSRLQPVKDTWLRFDKIENRFVRRIAGRRFANRLYFGFQLGVLEHTGRRSGRTYRTPLGAYRLGDGFVFALFYGPDVDWARNVLAAAGAALVWNGQDYRLQRPEIVSAAAVLPDLPLWPRLVITAAGTKQFLWMHQASDGDGDGQLRVLSAESSS
jgi:deazaflavin-dependent oxidoreductase (nitroreductase family)